MKLIQVPGVNEALREGLWWLRMAGEREETRNGYVLRSPVPVVTQYTNPQNRVLYNKVRDANPFFHLMEALWMLAGRNDLNFVSQFNKGMEKYSDDGQTLNGAYGYRWRQHFKFDQLAMVANLLSTEPNSRRAVVTMWDPATDGALVYNGADVPCNTNIYFEIVDGKLDMTVCCRSNDIVWGAYGANAVHFSILLEYMAARVGVPMGMYRQISINYHQYLDVVDSSTSMDMIGASDYEWEEPHPLVSVDPDYWDADVQAFVACNPAHDMEFADPFFNQVAMPMYRAWVCRKMGQMNACATHLSHIAADDWRRACTEWCQRRVGAATAPNSLPGTTPEGTPGSAASGLVRAPTGVDLTAPSKGVA